jgi:SAM-dependent methyltransferase
MKIITVMQAKVLLKKIFKYGYVGGICRYLHFMKVIKNLNLPKLSLKVLDAGCGNGEIAYSLAKKFRQFSVFAFDKKRSPYWDLLSTDNLQFCIKDLQNEHIGISEYDIVYTIDVLEHIKNNKLVLKALAQALKPGGFLIVLMPSLYDNKRLFGRRFYKNIEDSLAKEHIGERYTLTELCSIIRDMKFEILEARHTFGFFGQLASDIETFLTAIIGPIVKCFLPLFIMLSYLDVLWPNKDGNGLCIVAQKKSLT